MKALKLPNEDKSFNIFNERLVEAECKLPTAEKTEEREEIDIEKERRFAKLQGARAKERHGPGPGGLLTYSDTWDEVTDEEIDYYKKKALQVPPEQRYQIAKSRPPQHDFRWTSRGLYHEKTGYEFDTTRGYFIKKKTWCGGEIKGCNEDTGCVSDCRFYPDKGRIEDDEVIELYEKWKRDRDTITREEKRAVAQRVHNYNLVYDDDTEEEIMQRQLEREKWQREHPDWRQWF